VKIDLTGREITLIILAINAIRSNGTGNVKELSGLQDKFVEAIEKAVNSQESVIP